MIIHLNLLALKKLISFGAGKNMIELSKKEVKIRDSLFVGGKLVTFFITTYYYYIFFEHTKWFEMISLTWAEHLKLFRVSWNVVGKWKQAEN